MTQPAPSQPDQSPESEPVIDDEAVEIEVPLNRAERRAKAKGKNPSHVGPQAGRSDQGKGPRSHTKRQLG